MDEVLYREMEQDYQNRYAPENYVDDYIYQIDEQIDLIQSMCNEDIQHTYAYEHILEAIEQLRRAKEYLQEYGGY